MFNSNCHAPAKYLPVMLFYASRSRWPKAHPARSVAGIPVCEEHRSGITLDFLLTDVGFDNICKAFQLLGRALPDRAATKLEFIDIDSPEARSFLVNSKAGSN